ncbi:hypothetical protein [Acinetobacter sp. Marseille-Q1618]|uniref:hypothetical protein n=1 Tax=Acinetobacter sp. Marseille-Q1618 TaxID=2697502 RepID=UPI00156FBA30|nr:hypothetical protein [Acinetobacter sp. Marseille-Q1618]
MEYPKMLYTGDTVNYSCRVVHSLDEESQFREIGLVDFADLPESVVGYEPESTQEADAQLQTENAQLRVENEQLKTRIMELEQENQSLNAMMDSFQPSSSEVVTLPETEDLNALTVEQLRVRLDEKGVKYLKSDTKPVLVGLLQGEFLK